MRAYVTFTLDELWLMHYFIRADCPEIGRLWMWPPASKHLNDEIVLAINSCYEHDLPEFTLELTEGDLITIDHCIKPDYRGPTGANLGMSILRKAFKARAELATGATAPADCDHAYRGGDSDACAGTS